jgi:AraC-like DNA-binding protein
MVEQFRFSTEALPACERLATWRNIFERVVVDVEVEPLCVESFRSDLIGCRLPRLGVLFGFSDGLRLHHPRKAAKDDDLSFMTSHAQRWSATQRDRRPALGAGDGVLLSNADAWSTILASPARFMTFRVARSALEPLLPDPGAGIAQIIPADNAALRLLVSYLASSLAIEALATPELQQVAVGHVHELLAVALVTAFAATSGATREGAEMANGRGVRAARLNAIKADILAHLGARNLSLDGVAARQGISPVYIRKLLEGEDTSFTQFVLEQRLLRAHRMLRDPRFAGRPIAAIAMDAGFGDLSYFNRAFRRRYGAAPSDVRAAARDRG